ncbi:MAG: ABC transporter permease [Sphaerochaetaceae bacterium]|nr:ABC transporter permease [Sphaerochaetaceae bacterium]MDC7250565.1 ABC transporter permease [Sphaerochaetaceae bacterium]
MFWENVKLALSAMKSSKMRTALSLLGIVIGVGAVVAILNLGDSASQNITKSLNAGGTDIITIWTQPDERTEDVFTSEFGNTLKNSVEGIDSVIPQMMSSGAIRSNKKSVGAQIMGTESLYFSAQNLSFDKGKAYTLEQNINNKEVVVIGYNIAQELFENENPIGKRVNFILQSGAVKSYEVVGVLAKKEQSYTMSFDNSVFIPFNTFTTKLVNNDVVSSYVVKTNKNYDTIEVSDNLNRFLDTSVGNDSYQSFSPAMITTMANEVTATLSLFLAAIAGISLLVGGIGIMNIMLVSVAERTKEIGIRKALGASPSVIRGQFIVEAVTLTLLGGFLGIIFGSFISLAVTNLAGWTLTLSYKSFIVAVGFSMFVGIFFGWYPAMTASKLDPIEALNYE